MGTEPLPDSDQKTILIVNDDPDNLDSLAALLLEADYKVLRADNGVEACRQSKDYKNEIHLLLASFQMAEISGVELAKKIRGERPQLKVLLMSGYTEGMLSLGEGWRFLAKPHVDSDLRDLIGALLSRSEAPAVIPEPAPLPLSATAKVRSVGRRRPTVEKLPPASSSRYRRQSPPAAGRRSRGPRESSH